MVDAKFKKRSFGQALLEDVILQSKSMDENIAHLQKDFTVIRRHSLKLKIFGCDLSEK